ncbi:hypothetical protein WR25_21490 [Diploscapter pachys]|uniref:Uncharacterized protein n=1 Tax=Diploscapter pachys TaxID=2018661 RepID=A0A2A2LXM9_9BILA|nr:hypothetical protein WR25_21490 [Diploscapter pachys]
MHPYGYPMFIVKRSGCGFFSHLIALGVGYWMGKKICNNPPDCLADREKFMKQAEEWRRKMLSEHFNSMTFTPPIQHQVPKEAATEACPTCSHPLPSSS